MRYLRVQMDDHVRFSGTKYEKGNNIKCGDHCKCGENCSKIRGRTPNPTRLTAEEEEEEDLFVFNDTIEGPRAPAVKPGRITQA